MQTASKGTEGKVREGERRERKGGRGP